MTSYTALKRGARAGWSTSSHSCGCLQTMRAPATDLSPSADFVASHSDHCIATPAAHAVPCSDPSSSGAGLTGSAGPAGLSPGSDGGGDVSCGAGAGQRSFGSPHSLLTLFVREEAALNHPATTLRPVPVVSPHCFTALAWMPKVAETLSPARTAPVWNTAGVSYCIAWTPYTTLSGKPGNTQASSGSGADSSVGGLFYVALCPRDTVELPHSSHDVSLLISSQQHPESPRTPSKRSGSGKKHAKSKAKAKTKGKARDDGSSSDSDSGSGSGSNGEDSTSANLLTRFAKLTPKLKRVSGNPFSRPASPAARSESLEVPSSGRSSRAGSSSGGGNKRNSDSLSAQERCGS